MHTLGHLATADCIIFYFCFCQNGGIINLINQAFIIISFIFSMRTIPFSPMVWFVTKGGLSFPVVLVADPHCSFQAVCFPGPASYLILHNSVSNGQCLCSTGKKVLDSGSHHSLEHVVWVWASPNMVCQDIHSHHWMYSGTY